ncbi:MAG: MG2 domain-containing protein, partial [Planctomycetota bacterium]
MSRLKTHTPALILIVFILLSSFLVYRSLQHRGSLATYVFVPESESGTKGSSLRILAWDFDENGPAEEAVVSFQGWRSEELASSTIAGIGNLELPGEVALEGGALSAESSIGSSKMYLYRRHGEKRPEHRETYVTADRTLYLPGDIVRLRVLRKTEESDPGDSPSSLRVVLVNPAGQMVLRRELTLNEFGLADTEFELDTEAPTGTYDVRLDGMRGPMALRFRVAYFRKPPMKIVVRRIGPECFEAYARYPEGEPVSGASLSFEEDGGFKKRLGHLTEEGKLRFSLPEDTDWAGRVGQFVIVDGAGRRGTVPARIGRPSGQDLSIRAVPEAGALLPGVMNRVYVRVEGHETNGDGASIRLHVAGREAENAIDGSGYAALDLDVPAWKNLEKKDFEFGRDYDSEYHDSSEKLRAVFHYLVPGRMPVRRNVALPVFTRDSRFLLRPEKPLESTADGIGFEITTALGDGPVLVDAYKGTQFLGSTQVETRGGRAVGEVRLPDEAHGKILLLAYRPCMRTNDESWYPESPYPSMFLGWNTVLVSPGLLEIHVSCPSDDVGPGDRVPLEFEVTGPGAFPKALSVSAVDDRIYQLDGGPGLSQQEFFSGRDPWKGDSDRREALMSLCEDSRKAFHRHFSIRGDAGAFAMRWASREYLKALPRSFIVQILIPLLFTAGLLVFGWRTHVRLSRPLGPGVSLRDIERSARIMRFAFIIPFVAFAGLFLLFMHENRRWDYSLDVFSGSWTPVLIMLGAL